MLAFANLPDPPRTRAQLSAGIAANAEPEHLLTKLVYFSHARGPEGFPHEFRTDFTKVWGYMFGKHLFSEDNYIDYLKTSKAHRALLTWKGVVKVPNQDVAIFLEDTYEKNLPLVKQNLERKQNQSNIAKKRKAEEETQQQQAQASSAQADAPSSSAAAFLGPDPTADAAPRATDPQRTVYSAASSSGQPEARGHTTWSCNRDYYGMQREWSWYRGQWWYRDGAGGRWVLWRR